jgi:hypothetical protein
MKKQIKYVITAFILAGVIFYSSCGDNGGDEVQLTDQQKATSALVEGSPWTVASIDSQPNDVDANELQNLSLTFNASGTGAEITPGGISASGAANFIEATSSSTWAWASESATSTITLTNASVEEFTNVNFVDGVDDPTALELSFTVSSDGGRTTGIVGDYRITLSPNQ